MESLSKYYTRLSQESKINKQAYRKIVELTKDSKTYIFTFKYPEVLPAEPTTKPAPVVTPMPNPSPWIFPQPKIDSPPKGFL